MFGIECDVFAQADPVLPDSQGLLEHILGGQLARPARIGVCQREVPGRVWLLFQELLEPCDRLAVTPAGQVLLGLAFNRRGGKFSGRGFPARCASLRPLGHGGDRCRCGCQRRRDQAKRQYSLAFGPTLGPGQGSRIIITPLPVLQSLPCPFYRSVLFPNHS